MGRTPYFRTSIELEHHFSNLEQTRTCSFAGDQTPIPYLLVMGRTPFYRTSIELEHHFSNIERTRTCSLIISRTSNEHRTNIEHFRYFYDT